MKRIVYCAPDMEMFCRMVLFSQFEVSLLLDEQGKPYTLPREPADMHLVVQPSMKLGTVRFEGVPGVYVRKTEPLVVLS